MIELMIQLFGGGGSGSGLGADRNSGRGKGSAGGTGTGTGTGSGKKSSVKLGNEIYSSKGIKKDGEYAVVSSKTGEKTIRTGEQLLRQISEKSLSYDDDLYHWVGKKGSYIIRRIIRRK